MKPQCALSVALSAYLAANDHMQYVNPTGAETAAMLKIARAATKEALDYLDRVISDQYVPVEATKSHESRSTGKTGPVQTH